MGNKNAARDPSPLRGRGSMDTGKEFSRKVLSDEPIKLIRAQQQVIQKQNAATGMVHLVSVGKGLGNRAFGVHIPMAMSAVMLGMVISGQYKLMTGSGKMEGF